MKLLGGRFENQIEKVAFDLQSSIHVYRRLYREDILGKEFLNKERGDVII